MVLTTIKIRGFDGYYRADVIAFTKWNKEYLIEIMQRLGLNVNPNSTLKQLKEAAKEYDDKYPRGFKHIEGVYCYYYCLG